MITIEDLTVVTQAIEDTDEDDEDDEEDLTDVTLVSDDTYWRLDWCLLLQLRILMKMIKMTKKTWLMWPWWVMIPFDLIDVTLAIEEVMKVIKWWKLSSDESYEVMKVIKW